MGIGYDSIERMINTFEIKTIEKYGYSDAERILAPLFWWINTDRCPLDYLEILVNTNNRQKTTIIKRLYTYRSGNYDDALANVKEYLDKIGGK